MKKRTLNWSFIVLLAFFAVAACNSEKNEMNRYPYRFGQFDPPEVQSSDWQSFNAFFEQPLHSVNAFGLTKIPAYVNRMELPHGSFGEAVKFVENEKYRVNFYPLDQPIYQRFQYTHRYIHKYNPEFYHYANIAYPNPGHQKKYAQAKAIVENKSKDTLCLDLQLLFQNVSYAYPTSSQIDTSGAEWYRTNYFGGSEAVQICIPPNKTEDCYLPYIIGKDPKDDAYERTGLYGPARPGEYEFMLWTKPAGSKLDPWRDSLVFWKMNPFAELQKSLMNKDSSFFNQRTAYVPPGHFRFKLLNETFDGYNMLEPGWVYFTAEGDQKKLCDTCDQQVIYNKDVIRDRWTPDAFFEGDISKASRIPTTYGNRHENVALTENGLFLRIPGSNPQKKQKTWGEWKFKPEFMYGTLKVVAKLAQVRNEENTPTGIIHNLWLYQKRYTRADTFPGNPYNYLTNDAGKQPFEIDIEIWSKIYEEPWKDAAFANYSIVDYMRDEEVKVKPGDEMIVNEKDKVDRFNNYQLNYPIYQEMDRSFFEEYHMYEIKWSPQAVEFYIDHDLKARIDKTWAKIPDQPCNVWINSPIYQDGTFCTQSDIPFFSKDHFSHIRFISIE